MKKRDDFLDLVKGICIFFVVVGHLLAHFESCKFFINFIYSFHMPILIWISAYLDEQIYSSCQSYQFIIHKAKALLIPYCIWFSIIYICLPLINGIHTFSFYSLLSVFFAIGTSSGKLWFLFVLFLLKLIHMLFWNAEKQTKKILKSHSSLWIGLFVLTVYAVFAILFWITKSSYFSNTLSYFIPYALGIVIVRTNKINKLIRVKPFLIICAIAYCTCLLFFFDFYNSHWTTQIIRIFMSVCIIFIIEYIHQLHKLSIFKIPSAIKYSFNLWGKHSMAIYLLHTFLVSDLVQYISLYSAPLMQILIASIIAIFGCFICTLISIFVNISPKIHKIIF